MHNYYVQVKFTALRGASDSSVTFESCLAAVDDPICDYSTGWMRAHIKCDLPCSSLAKPLPLTKKKNKPQKSPLDSLYISEN